LVPDLRSCGGAQRQIPDNQRGPADASNDASLAAADLAPGASPQNCLHYFMKFITVST
jgi:hypothetical protein